MQESRPYPSGFYRDRWDELESSRNPFAVVVMAHLKAIETAKDQKSRFKWKLKLVRRLYDQGYDRQDILELFRFIDWLLNLPEVLEAQFWQEINSFEERRQMQYVTSVERIGFKKGRQEGQANLLKRLLIHRFGELPNWVEERLSSATTKELERRGERLMDASSLEEVFDLNSGH